MNHSPKIPLLGLPQEGRHVPEVKKKNDLLHICTCDGVTLSGFCLCFLHAIFFPCLILCLE